MDKYKILFDSNIIDVSTLLVAIATFVVTCMAYRYSRRSSKKHLRNLIAKKQAQLTAMEESMRYGVEYSAASHLCVETSALGAEIEELKLQL